jgi:hypothetical protein
MGLINRDLNLTINANSLQVKLGQGGSATGYPSWAVYSYTYQGKKIVSKLIVKIPEGSNDGLDKPNKPIPASP